MQEDNLNNLNGLQDGVVDQEVVEVEQDSNPNVEQDEKSMGVVTPQQQEEEVENQGQSKEQNQQFADIRKKATLAGKDEAIKELLGQYGFNSYTEYKEYLQRQKQQQVTQQQAQELGINPKLATEFLKMRQQMEELQREKQYIEEDAKLSSDAEVGEFYKENKVAIQDIAAKYKTSYEVAMTYFIKQNFGKIAKGIKSNTEQSTIQGILNNQISTPGALNQGAGDKKVSIKDLTDAEFKKLQQKVLSGEQVQI